MCRHQFVSFACPFSRLRASALDMIVALDEILPRELGVARLRQGGRQLEAQRVGVVLGQGVGYIHGGATALAQLGSLEVEVFMVTRDKSLPF